MDALSLKKVKVSLPDGKTLFHIENLQVPSGSQILIEGESGEGKTTFLHLLAGLFLPSEGEIKFGSVSISTLSDDDRCALRRKRIGVIFQKLNLLDHLTVAENVSLAQLPNSKNENQVNHCLARVNLSGRERDLCSYLSLGEQQRVAVARVLCQEPDLILADEPTSSLDQKNSDFVMDALFEAAKGRTIIVVSHDHRLRSRFSKVISFKDLAK